MLTQLLIFSTLHFALSIFAAFVFFATGLLFLDAAKLKQVKDITLVRSIGFFLLAIVASFHATSIDIALPNLFIQILRIAGLTLILLGLLKEPLLSPPGKEKLALFLPFVLPLFTNSLIPLSAALLLIIAAVYYRKATEGYERQLKPVSLAFLFLGLAEALRISTAWEDTPVVFWSQMLAPFGLVWNLHHLLLLIGLLILASWTWGYIRFRLRIQLFVGTIAISLIIFLATTALFTFLLLQNLQANALSHLKTDVSVLQYSLESVKEKTLAYAETIANDTTIKQAVIGNDKKTLSSLSTMYQLSQKTSSLLIASSSAEVLMRAEDQDRFNESVSDDPVFEAALSGNKLATTTFDEGITAPIISVKAAAPILKESTIIGVVITSIVIDSAFVDGVKSLTELDITVFGKDKRAATTFIAPDGKSRFIGTLETNPKILDTVLTKAEVYLGPSQVSNMPYYTAYAPLKAHDGTVLGMLFVGEPQSVLVETATRSINLTFLGSIILILLSLIPTYFISRYLEEHTKA